MKKVLILFICLGVFATIAFASTDYSCMSDCSDQGYMYSFCKKKCSYDISPKNQRRKDYSCISDCTAKGYMYSYCTQLCSY